MKTNFFITIKPAMLIVSVCVMMLAVTSCNKSASQSNANTANSASDSTQAEMADIIENEPSYTGDIDFQYVRNNWKTQTINTKSEPTVADFMNVIMDHYDIEIQKGENDYSWEDIKDVEGGYCAVGELMSHNHVACMLWNRDNGHKLIPFLYGSIHGDGTLCFYDYDPKTRQLEMDSVISDKFKDIEPALYGKYGFSKYDYSGDTVSYTLYIWNGKDFTEYKSENEFLLNFWKPQKVKAVSRSGRPSVLDFMNTFTNYYGYQWVEDEFYKLDIRRGYCSVWSSDNVIECVIWNRNNKHVLICVSLITYFKYDCNCGPDSFQFLFYDYDPATKTMTAETQLTKRFRPYYENAEIVYDYGSVIPIQGKDIKIDDKIFKWNGHDFNFPKK